MNKYEKKRNYIQVLSKFEGFSLTIAFIAVVVGSFLVGPLVMKILSVSESPLPKSGLSYWIATWAYGFVGIAVCIFCGLLICSIVTIVLPGIKRNIHAMKIMRYLPLTKEDWEQFNVKTDEDAVHVLRDLVKTIGFNGDLINCDELCDQIIASYHAFLHFKYGDWDIIFDINDDVLIGVYKLALCSDADFDAKLEAERKKSRERRERWLARKKERESNM